MSKSSSLRYGVEWQHRKKSTENRKWSPIGLEIIYSSYKQLHILWQNLYKHLTEIIAYFQKSLVHNPIWCHNSNKNNLKWSSNQLFCLYKHQCVSTSVYGSLMICDMMSCKIRTTATLRIVNWGIQSTYKPTMRSLYFFFRFSTINFIQGKTKACNVMWFKFKSLYIL